MRQDNYSPQAAGVKMVVGDHRNESEQAAYWIAEDVSWLTSYLMTEANCWHHEGMMVVRRSIGILRRKQDSGRMLG